MIVCQGELPVTFEAADPKISVGAYPVCANIHVNLELFEDPAKLDVAVLQMMQKASSSKEEVATQCAVVNQRSSFLSCENDFQGGKCSAAVCHCKSQVEAEESSSLEMILRS